MREQPRPADDITTAPSTSNEANKDRAYGLYYHEIDHCTHLQLTRTSDRTGAALALWRWIRDQAWSKDPRRRTRVSQEQAAQRLRVPLRTLQRQWADAQQLGLVAAAGWYINRKTGYRTTCWIANDLPYDLPELEVKFGASDSTGITSVTGAFHGDDLTDDPPRFEFNGGGSMTRHDSSSKLAVQQIDDPPGFEFNRGGSSSPYHQEEPPQDDHPARAREDEKETQDLAGPAPAPQPDDVGRAEPLGSPGDQEALAAGEGRTGSESPPVAGQSEQRSAAQVSPAAEGGSASQTEPVSAGDSAAIIAALKSQLPKGLASLVMPGGRDEGWSGGWTTVSGSTIRIGAIGPYKHLLERQRAELQRACEAVLGVNGQVELVLATALAA